MTTLSTTSNNNDNITTTINTIKWGIVGLGDVTLQKSGPAFYKCDNSDLVAVMRRTPGKAQAWVQQQEQLSNECKGYDNLDEFLQHSGLSAVYIATPPGAHLEVATQVANAGLPAYVEKPVGRCAWETQKMVDVFAAKNVSLYTAYISRAYERTHVVQQLLQEGVVGDAVASIQYTLKGMGGARGMSSTDKLPWRLIAEQSGGGLIMDVGCHVVDRMDYLFGPLVNVQGMAANKNSPNQDVEDYVELHATIGESTWSVIDSVGAKVDCVWDFSSDESLDELVIQGPKGSLRMAAMSPSLPVQVLDANGNVVRELTFKAPQHTAQRMIQGVTNELAGTETIEQVAYISRGDNAIRTSKVLDTILSSYYGGRDDEFWKRPETWPGRPKR